MKYFAILTVFLLFYCCGKENPVAEQEKKIESYIKTKMSKNSNLKLSQNGDVFYLYESDGVSESVSAGDSVYFYYAAVLLLDTLKYFDTNIREIFDILGLDVSNRNFEPQGTVVGSGKYLKGLDIGLKMVHDGDAGEIIFNSDYGFGGKANGIVPSHSALIYKVFITGVRKK
ncbi:MAG: FKBP-type peptidyl-prolyl cis-trans isomerase [Prevotellaceae bacterium]|jgi:FKBP-type peptidyl-prolyl cis-trans isomerase|nr:FKBP-type peptidyl-prolyl cis-trans isomerase [Prevotellaceae bacterium]